MFVGISLIFIGIALLAIIMIVYFIIYRRHINKTLLLGPEAPRKEFPSPQRVFLTVFLIILLIVLSANSYSIKSNNDSLTDQVNYSNARIRQLEKRINELESAAENNYCYFESVEYEAAGFDETTGVFQLRLKVIPKITSEVTVTAECEGKEYIFEKQDSSYSALIDYTYPEEAKSFDDLKVKTEIILNLQSGDAVFTEKLSLTPGDITGLFFLTVTDGSSFAFTPGKTGYDVNGSVSISLNLSDYKNNTEYTGLNLVTTVNGNVANDISLFSESDGTLHDSCSYFNNWISFSVDATEKDEICIYLRLTLEDGYIFEIPCSFRVFDADGSGSYGKIYSADLWNSDTKDIISGFDTKEAVKGIILPDGRRLK